MRKEFSYPSCGAGCIHGLRWEPQGEVKAVVQLVHGIAERVERYDDFAEFLTRHCFLVVAEDHMGHGGSVAAGQTPGYFTGGWFCAVEDSYRLLRDTRAEFPNVPYILLGHSMGSFLARSILIRHPDSGITAAVLSGTAWMPSAVIAAGYGAARAVCAVKGEKEPSALLQGMMFGSYNARVEHRRTPSDWLTRDSAVVDAYEADPLCGFVPTAGLVRDMMCGLRYNQRAENLKKMRADLPVFFVAGGDDPVGNYGSGVRAAAQAFRDAGMQHVALKLYPLCRHEILNELNRDEVYADILAWITEQAAL